MEGLEKLHKGLTAEFSRTFAIVTKEHKEELGQTILNSLLDDQGPKHINRISSPKEKYFRKVFDAFSEIHSSYQALRDIEIYINRFPYSSASVTKPRYLRYHIENYFSEVYLLKKRLLAFLTSIGRGYRKDKRHATILAATRPLFKLISESLEGVVITRGRHVHEKRYSDPKIERLELMELLSKGAGEDDLLPHLRPYYQVEYRRIRSEWKVQIKRNNEAVNLLLAAYSEVVSGVLFPEEGNQLVYPASIVSGRENR